MAGVFLWLVASLCCHGASIPGDTNRVPAKAEAKRSDALEPNDMVWIRVFQEDDLEVKAIIDREGQITVPLLGPLKVAELTPQEATTMIRDLYEADYLVDPKVTLVVEKAKRHFTVMGQVQKPGTFDLPTVDPLNLLQAIAIAGGYTRLAAPSKVRIQRVEDGRPVVIDLNAEKMARDRKSKPVEIMPDDIVTVGERVF